MHPFARCSCCDDWLNSVSTRTDWPQIELKNVSTHCKSNELTTSCLEKIKPQEVVKTKHAEEEVKGGDAKL